jgi:hypothetical protein
MRHVKNINNVIGTGKLKVGRFVPVKVIKHVGGVEV